MMVKQDETSNISRLQKSESPPNRKRLQLANCAKGASHVQIMKPSTHTSPLEMMTGSGEPFQKRVGFVMLTIVTYCKYWKLAWGKCRIFLLRGHISNLIQFISSILTSGLSQDFWSHMSSDLIICCI